MIITYGENESLPGNESAEATTSDCGFVFDNRLLFGFEVVVLGVV